MEKKNTSLIIILRSTLSEIEGGIHEYILSEPDVNQVLTIALDEVIEISKAERGLIILFDDDGAPLFQTYRNLNKVTIENPEFDSGTN